MTEKELDQAILEAFKKVFPEHFGEEKVAHDEGQWTPWNTKKFNGNYEEERNAKDEHTNS